MKHKFALKLLVICTAITLLSTFLYIEFKFDSKSLILIFAGSWFIGNKIGVATAKLLKKIDEEL